MRKHLGLVPTNLLLVPDQGTIELLDSLWCHLVASDGPILYIMSHGPLSSILMCVMLYVYVFFLPGGKEMSGQFYFILKKKS